MSNLVEQFDTGEIDFDQHIFKRFEFERLNRELVVVVKKRQEEEKSFKQLEKILK